MKKSIIHSLLTYVLFFISIGFFYKSGNLENYTQFFILGFVLIIIKDMLLYCFSMQNTTRISYNTSRIFSGENSTYYKFLFVNRHYFFPFVLIIYIVFLLLQQSHLLGLNNHSFFKIIDSNLLLGVTILSGVLTIFKEAKDELYKTESKNTKGITGNIILTVILSLLGTYIIYNQTYSLGFLTYPISVITGILIFLVGISILEDEKIN